MSIEKLHKEPLLEKVMEKGKRTINKNSLAKIKAYTSEQLHNLPDEYKRFNNPHIYKIGISKELKTERDKLIQTRKY